MTRFLRTQFFALAFLVASVFPGHAQDMKDILLKMQEQLPEIVANPIAYEAYRAGTWLQIYVRLSAAPAGYETAEGFEQGLRQYTVEEGLPVQEKALAFVQRGPTEDITDQRLDEMLTAYADNESAYESAIIGPLTEMVPSLTAEYLKESMAFYAVMSFYAPRGLQEAWIRSYIWPFCQVAG